MLRTFAVICLASGLPIRITVSQITGTLDAGISVVRYDGFLTSTAGSFTPAVRWERSDGRVFLSARGTYLRFESGNRSLDGTFAGSLSQPLGGQWRGDVAIAAGASDYADIASFRHGIAELRLHHVNGRRGTWVALSGGRAWFGSDPRPITVASVGVWGLRSNLTLLASADHSVVGDTVYTDFRSSARWYRASVILDAAVGLRVWSRGAGRGLYGEASVTVPLGPRTTIVLGGGRYPTDAVSGSIAGKYVTAALRLSTAQRRVPRPERLPVVLPLASAGANGGGSSNHVGPLLEVLSAGPEGARLRFYAPGAATVEIAADFTEWRPELLTQTAEGWWELATRIPRGAHRINVRVNGGAWSAPAGTTHVADDYGGLVGFFVVP